MPIETLKYNILISCPSDIIDEIEIIHDTIKNFNRTFGPTSNIVLATKHWKDDSFPESGNHPQELLNKQIVKDSDAIIAIFWTRFGSPTLRFDSGTEEEIEEMINSGKQVFLYFCDKPIRPSQKDEEQYNKVLVFKEKYKGRGIYYEYSTNEEFKEHLLVHLYLYFLQELSMSKDKKNDSKIIIYEIDKINNNEAIKPKQIDFLINSNYLELKEKIIAIFKKINTTKLPKNERNLIKETAPDDVKKALNIPIDSVFKYKKVSIEEEDKEKVISFCDKNNIELSKNFFNFLDLQSYTDLLTKEEKYRGDEVMIEKYREYIQLVANLYLYYDWENYLSKLSNLLAIDLVVTNIGKRHDENIEVLLKIKKNMLCKVEEFPEPELLLIDNFNDNEYLNEFIKIPVRYDVEEYYTDEITMPYDTTYFPQGLDYLFQSNGFEYEKEKERYEASLREIMCYSFYETSQYDVLKFKIPSLKHNTSIAFPSRLFFKEKPEEIIFEIKSNFNPEISKGILIIQ